MIIHKEMKSRNCDNKLVEPRRRLEFMFGVFCFSFSFTEIYFNDFSFQPEMKFRRKIYFSCPVLYFFRERVKKVRNAAVKETVVKEPSYGGRIGCECFILTCLKLLLESADSNDRN